MKYHEIEMVGKFIVEKSSGLPTFDVNRDEGRLVLDTSTNRINFGDSGGWRGVAQYVKHNFTGTRAPTATDDADSGYQEGSVWIDTSASPEEAYRCVDSTVSTAIWKNTSLEIGELGTLANQDASNVSITGGSISGINDLAIADGGTGASSSSVARNNLGLGTMATQSAGSVNITGGSLSGVNISLNDDLAIADGGTGASTAGDARINLGLGTISTQAASNVSITGGSISGITDLAIADGGTGASNTGDARTNLGLGTAATESDTKYAHRINNLSDLNDSSTARTNLGLDTMATQAASNVSITGGSISGITDLAIADGGTGASTAAGARTNLGLENQATTTYNISTTTPTSADAGSDGDVWYVVTA